MIATGNQINSFYYNRYFHVDCIDKEVLQKVNKIFNYYKAKGVIINKNFEDDIWYLKDRTNLKSLSFKFSVFDYEKFAHNWIGCNSECFKETMKIYIALHMGQWASGTLSETARLLRKVAISDFPKSTGFKEQSIYVVEFLRLLPGMSVTRNAALDLLEDIAAQYSFSLKTQNQRKLLSFTDYFKFDKEISEYWIKADEEKRCYYFPLFLWWKLTTILPLRVTEFLLTPKDCISCNSENKFFIEIRRSKLKGTKGLVHYSIDEDYEKKKYPVSDNIANEILWYKNFTEGMVSSSIDSLFCIEPYRAYHPLACYDFYTYDYFIKTKNDFYNTILKYKDIPVINPGDTRHIAMINLIISGGSPRMCMELAGHSNIDISSHYYANVVSLIECATHELYKKTKQGASAKINGSDIYHLTPLQDLVKVHDGWCSSSSMRSGEVDDCVMAINSLGEIGDCKCCRYFLRDMQGKHIDFYDTKQSRQKVLANSWFVIQMMEAVRRGIGCKEDIYQAILRLQHSCNNYKECLLYKHEMEEQNGKTKENQ